MEQAARGIAYGTFSRGGQVCIRIKRVYVDEEVADELMDRLIGIASRLDLEEDVGPLIREEARAKVDASVKDALLHGAKLMYGGNPVKGPGYFYEPTILLHNDDSLDVVRNETFGPVCPIRTFKDEDTAVELANGTRYGLGASIWTKDTEKGEGLARKMDAGNVWINECSRTLPGGDHFQGWKQSGIATSQSRLQMFQRRRTMVVNRSPGPRVHWFA